MNHNKPQKPPEKNLNQSIVSMVIADLKERAEDGKKKYGTYLQADNGRDALVDALQESYDMCMYLRQAVEERKVPAEEKETGFMETVSKVIMDHKHLNGYKAEFIVIGYNVYYGLISEDKTMHSYDFLEKTSCKYSTFLGIKVIVSEKPDIIKIVDTEE